GGGQALSQHERRRDFMLAGVPPRRAGAAVLDALARGPQRDLEIAGGAAHDGRDALGGADETADPGLPGVARPLAQRLAAHAGHKSVDRRLVDHYRPRGRDSIPRNRRGRTDTLWGPALTPAAGLR